MDGNPCIRFRGQGVAVIPLGLEYKEHVYSFLRVTQKTRKIIPGETTIRAPLYPKP